MTDWDLSEEDRALAVDLAGQSVPLGRLADMSASEAGMVLLGAMSASTRQDWSASNAVAFAKSSLADQVPRRSGTRSRDFSPLVVRKIGDAFAWLISNALIGPAGAQSGSSGEWNVTTIGANALARGSAAHVEATRRLHIGLHPALEGVVRDNFERGEYEVAVFAAMRAVEVSLREAAKLGPDSFGSALATEALKSGGPLSITTETAAEQHAYMYLFMGAIGAFKNPSSHRVVEYADPAEAADVIHLADLLLRIIDREQANRAKAEPPAN